MYTFINVNTTVYLTVMWVFAGLLLYFLLWIRHGEANTPVTSEKSSIYKDSTKDHKHTNLFKFMLRVMQILYIDDPLAFIDRYGLELY